MYSYVCRRSTTAETTAAPAHLGVTTYMFFLIFVFVTFLRVLYNNIHHHVNQRGKLHTYSAQVSVSHTPVEVRFRMTCRFIHGQGKRGNVHTPAIMSVAFHDVVFDGFIHYMYIPSFALPIYKTTCDVKPYLYSHCMCVTCFFD